MDKKGKLIVIDGSDGSGKATQTKLLVDRLLKAGIRTKTLDFPRYEENLMGALIGECIAGMHGDFSKMDPYVASVLYAADRYESRATLRKWLDDGNVVVLDRYVSANQIHQGGKLRDARTRTRFLEWLDKLEYGVFDLPIPDTMLYLQMPLEHSLKLLQEKRAQTKKSVYLKKGAKDTVESDRDYLKNALVSAEFLIQKHKGWQKISCTKGGSIRTREDIHDEVFDACKKLLKLRLAKSV
jgi:thymidylate kinase